MRIRGLPALLTLLLLAVPAGAQVQVAVVDTGVDDDHPALAGRVEHVRFTGRPDRPGQIPALPGLPDDDDPDGHGTAAGSVVAGGDGLGLAPNATVLDLQVRVASALPLDRTEEAAVLEALDHALQNVGEGAEGLRVVLLSFADRPLQGAGTVTMAAQARALFDAGVVVVVPAGDSVLHVAPHVLSVVGAGSCAGPRVDGKPDLAALPSATVASPATATEAAPTAQARGGHVAAARVAGVAANVIAARPELPVAALLDILRDTSTDVLNAGPDGCGFGELDEARALQAAQAWTDPHTLPNAPVRGSPGVALVLGLLVLVLSASRRRRQPL